MEMMGGMSISIPSLHRAKTSDLLNRNADRFLPLEFSMLRLRRGTAIRVAAVPVRVHRSPDWGYQNQQKSVIFDSSRRSGDDLWIVLTMTSGRSGLPGS